MPHININDSHYYYELHGQGYPVVLIAGYSCDHTFWSAMLSELTKNFQVLIFDNRAVGQTQDIGTSLSLEAMADETMQLFQTLKLTQPIIVGQSMGGIIAQIIAKKYPALIRKLIVLNSAAQINIRTRMALESFINLLKKAAPIEEVIEASMPWFFSSQFLNNPENISFFKKSIINNPYPQSLIDLERQMHALKNYESSNFSSQIDVPTLVIGAKEDIVCLPEESEALAHSISQAELAMLNCGHSSPLEVPKEVCKTIVKFF